MKTALAMAEEPEERRPPIVVTTRSTGTVTLGCDTTVTVATAPGGGLITAWQASS